MMDHDHANLDRTHSLVDCMKKDENGTHEYDRHQCILKSKECNEVMEILKRNVSLLELFCYKNLFDRKLDKTFSKNMNDTIRLLKHADVTLKKAIDTQSNIIVPELCDYTEAETLDIMMSEDSEKLRTLMYNQSVDDMKNIELRAKERIQTKYPIPEQRTMTQNNFIHRMEDSSDRTANIHFKECQVLKHFGSQTTDILKK